jgi:hypothetical protein
LKHAAWADYAVPARAVSLQETPGIGLWVDPAFEDAAVPDRVQESLFAQYQPDMMGDPARAECHKIPGGERVSGKLDPPEPGVRLLPRDDRAHVGAISSAHRITRQLVGGKEAALAVNPRQEMNAVDADTAGGGVRMDHSSF